MGILRKFGKEMWLAQLLGGGRRGGKPQWLDPWLDPRLDLRLATGPGEGQIISMIPDPEAA
jgi:hypothetical protein